MTKVVKNYQGFESLTDIERDISELVEELEMPLEFTGTVTLTLEYSE